MHRMLSQNFPPTSEELHWALVATAMSVNEIRKQERRKEKQVWALLTEDVHCYDWKTFVEKRELDILKVFELDKYIEHNELSKKGKKIDKIKRITIMKLNLISFKRQPVLVRTVMRVNSDSGLVLCDESESVSESDDDSHTVTIQEGTSTRSGHRVGHWSTRYDDFIQWTGTPYRDVDWRGLEVAHIFYKVIWGWVKN